VRNIIIKSVKNYVSTYLNEDILPSEKFNLEKCKCIKIGIKEKEKQFFMNLKISLHSLEHICNTLFGFSSEDMYDDVGKEMLNVIAGNILLHMGSEYELQIPQICNSCKTEKGIFFRNKNIQFTISISK